LPHHHLGRLLTILVPLEGLTNGPQGSVTGGGLLMKTAFAKGDGVDW